MIDSAQLKRLLLWAAALLLVSAGAALTFGAPLSVAGGHEGGGHHAPHSLFTAIWEHVKDTSLGKFYSFDNPELGQFWFDAIGFSLIGATLLVVCASMATAKYNKVPRGMQNVFEWA